MELSMPAAKKAAISLRYFLKENGTDISLALAQEALARTRGAASFQVLLAAEAADKTIPAPVVPAPAAFDTTMVFVVRALDGTAVRQAAATYAGMDENQPPGNLLLRLCVEHDASLNGCKLGVSSIEPAACGYGPDCWQVSVQAHVTDENKLVCAAQERYIEVWQDVDEATSIQDANTALYELLCSSNSRPPPCDLGFEYVEHLTDCRTF